MKKIRQMAKRAYWNWEESHIRNTVHWALFLSVGLITVFHLISSITTSAVENDGFGVYNETITAMVNET